MYDLYIFNAHECLKNEIETLHKRAYALPGGVWIDEIKYKIRINKVFYETNAPFIQVVNSKLEFRLSEDLRTPDKEANLAQFAQEVADAVVEYSKE